MTKLTKLFNNLDNLEYTKNIIDEIISYKNKLDKIPQDKLDDNQNFWLLAHETAEKRIATSSKKQIAKDMTLLSKFIPNNK